MITFHPVTVCVFVRLYRTSTCHYAQNGIYSHSAIVLSTPLWDCWLCVFGYVDYMLVFCRSLASEENAIYGGEAKKGSAER